MTHRSPWHIARDGDGLLLYRGARRWDVAASTVLPRLRPLRLAHQIRQDLWRLLRDLRGFQPMVEVRSEGAACHVTAGGAIDGAIPPNATGRIAGLLDDPDRRARWSRYARIL